ncbi:hypothetical protein [Candidatus Pyrohabitans sp.]
MAELRLDPRELKEVLEKRGIRARASWCMFCGATKGAEPMPAQFKPIGFEQTKELIASGVISELVSQLPEKAMKAGWCMFCGAQSSKAPGVVASKEELTDEVIEELSRDILKLVK